MTKHLTAEERHEMAQRAEQARKGRTHPLEQLNSYANIQDTATELQRRFDADGENHEY